MPAFIATAKPCSVNMDDVRAGTHAEVKAISSSLLLNSSAMEAWTRPEQHYLFSSAKFGNRNACKLRRATPYSLYTKP
jgi:hypothetical protein